MLTTALSNIDVVFARNTFSTESLPYAFGKSIFNRFYKSLCGIDFKKDAPPFRVINKKIVNYILQHPRPNVSYRLLPKTAGFSVANLTYSSHSIFKRTRPWRQSVN